MDTDPDNDMHRATGAGFDWASRVLTVVVVMVGPGLAGDWLDQKWGTAFMGPLGFIVGVPLGIYYLVQVTKPRPVKPPADAGVKENNQDTPLDHSVGE